MRRHFFEMLFPYLGRTSSSIDVQSVVRKYQRYWKWPDVNGQADWCLLLPMYLIRRVRSNLRWHGSVSMLVSELDREMPVELYDAKNAQAGDILLRLGPRGHAGVALSRGGEIAFECNLRDAARISEGSAWDTAWRWWDVSEGDRGVAGTS